MYGFCTRLVASVMCWLCVTSESSAGGFLLLSLLSPPPDSREHRGHERQAQRATSPIRTALSFSSFTKAILFKGLGSHCSHSSSSLAAFILLAARECEGWSVMGKSFPTEFQDILKNGRVGPTCDNHSPTYKYTKNTSRICNFYFKKE